MSHVEQKPMNIPQFSLYLDYLNLSGSSDLVSRWHNPSHNWINPAYRWNYSINSSPCAWVSMTVVPCCTQWLQSVHNVIWSQHGIDDSIRYQAMVTCSFILKSGMKLQDLANDLWLKMPAYKSAILRGPTGLALLHRCLETTSLSVINFANLLVVTDIYIYINKYHLYMYICMCIYICMYVYLY